MRHAHHFHQQLLPYCGIAVDGIVLWVRYAARVLGYVSIFGAEEAPTDIFGFLFGGLQSDGLFYVTGAFRCGSGAYASTLLLNQRSEQDISWRCSGGNQVAMTPVHGDLASV
jgi:hypothetical protein